MESFSSKLQALTSGRPLFWTGAATVLYLFGVAYLTGQARKLKHIPTVGSTWPLLSYVGSFGFMKDAKNVLADGVSKWPVFKVSNLSEWLVIVSEPQAIEDVKKAPEKTLSAFAALDELLQTRFTLGPQISDNPYHIPLIRVQLTRALPQLISAVHEEIEVAFNKHIPQTENWTSVKVADTFMKIVAQAINHIFVGPPLCRNPDYLELNIRFTIDVVKIGSLIRMAPPPLRPLVNYFLSSVPKRTGECVGHLAPLIAERRKEREEQGDNYEKPVDLLTMLMDEAKGEEEEARNLTVRIMTSNFGALHTSSITFTQVFYYLAAHSEYIEPLREEIEEIITRHGWTKEGVDQMHKLDSFIKETQRLSPISSLIMNRIAMSDYTFSDGTTVPAGTTINVMTNTHFDEETYASPHKFDGFRFVKMKKHAEENGQSDKQFDSVSTSVNSLAFGIGRHACPGRFIATSEIKMMLAHLILTYDVKLENEGVRPLDTYIMANCIPNPTAEVLFRKRK